MAIGPLPPVISEIQANSGQPGKMLAQQTAASSLLDLQATAAEPAVAIVPETTLIDKAVAEALGRQGGLASLYATLAELADAADLPDAVKAAVDTVLAFRIGDSEVTPERVAQAIRASGLFHEAVAAGKMAAALPPAVRQALGGAPAQKPPQVAAPPAASSSVPTAVARPASIMPASVPPVAGKPSSSTQANVGQGGSSVSVQASPPAPNVPSVAVPSVTPGAMPPAAAPGSAANVTPPSLSVTAAPSENAAVAPPLSAAAGELPSVTPPVPAHAATPLPAAQDGPISPPLPAQTQATGDDGATAVPQAINLAGPPSPSPASLLPPTTPTAGQPASSSTSSSSSGSQPPAPSSAPTSSPPESGTPVPSPSAAASTPSVNVASSSRAFAPWTPGRPLVPAASTPTSALPPAGAPSGAEQASPLAAPVPAGSEAASHRLPGDRAPFVPSTVDSLPSAPSGPVTPPRVPVGPTAPPPVVDALAQSAAYAPASASVSQSGPATTAGQEGSQSQQVSPQTRPASVTSAAPLAPPLRQSASLIAAAPTVAMPAAVGIDLKGALDGLRRELVAWLGRNADVMASLDGSGDDAATSRVDRPVPPRKGGPVRGQPAVSFFNGDEAEPASTETLAGRALGEAERSLSRVFLHQAATAESRDMKSAQPAQALMLEIPIAGPNGTSIAQLRIERDDRAPTEPGAPPRRVFQVDIAFDIAPLGPVAVRVGLMDGRRVAIGVWCESDDGLVRMEAERENIVLGLEQEGMVVAGVDLHRGHPPEGRDEMAAVPSHRLDLQL